MNDDCAFSDILVNPEQKMIIPCKICRAPAKDYGNDYPLCEEHISEALSFTCIY